MTWQTNSVRDLLNQIRLALGGTAQVELLAEMRYLNQRLWGSDATNPVVGAVPLSDQLVQSLYVLDSIGGGPVAPVGLAGYLQQRLLAAGAPTLDSRLLEMLASLASQREDLHSEDGNTTPGAMLEALQQLLNGIGPRIGTGTGATSVQGWLAALQNQGTISNELTETYGNANNAAQSAMTNILQCICDNTTPPEEGPETSDPCNISSDAPAYTARVTSWTDGAVLEPPYASGFSGLPPGAYSSAVPNQNELHFRTNDDWDICMHWEGEPISGYNAEMRYHRNDGTHSLVAQVDLDGVTFEAGLVEALEVGPTGSTPYWHRVILDTSAEVFTPPNGILWIEFWPVAT